MKEFKRKVCSIQKYITVYTNTNPDKLLIMLNCHGMKPIADYINQCKELYNTYKTHNKKDSIMFNKLERAFIRKLKKGIK